MRYLDINALYGILRQGGVVDVELRGGLSRALSVARVSGDVFVLGYEDEDGAARELRIAAEHKLRSIVRVESTLRPGKTARKNKAKKGKQYNCICKRRGSTTGHPSKSACDKAYRASMKGSNPAAAKHGKR